MTLALGHEVDLGHMSQISVKTIPCHPPRLCLISPPSLNQRQVALACLVIPEQTWSKIRGSKFRCLHSFS